jgi:putative membrane protein
VVRLLISIGFSLLANALGLVVAAWVLDDVTLSTSGFLVAVLVFTGVQVLTQPLITQIAIKQANALRGSSALIAAFIGIVVTAVFTDGLSIDGATAWLLTTVIVWAVSLLAGFLLPAIFLKKAVEERRS